MIGSDRHDLRAIVIDFAVSAAVSAVLITAHTLYTEHAGLQSLAYAMILLMLDLNFTLWAILLLAVPAYLVFSRLKLVTLWSTLASGFSVGAIAASVTEWPQRGVRAFFDAGMDDHAVRRISAYAIIGAVSAFAFWISRRWRAAGS